MSSSRRLQERDVYIPPGRRNRTTTTASTTQPGGNELGKGRSVFSFSETSEAAGTKTVTASTEQGTDAGVGNPSSGNSRKAGEEIGSVIMLVNGFLRTNQLPNSNVLPMCDYWIYNVFFIANTYRTHNTYPLLQPL